MYKIEKVYADDFERIYPQLLKFQISAFSKDDWHKLFVHYWESPEEFFGYMLLKDGEVKGFLGLIFSNRIIKDKNYKFCNHTSWVVDEDCRHQSLFLLLEALKLKDYIFTCFTASTTVATIFKRFGYNEFAVNQQVLLPMPDFRLIKGDYSCEFDLKKIRNLLSKNERILFDDHQNLGCKHIVLKTNSGYSYLILKKTIRRNLPFLKVHYLSNAEHFVEAVERFILKICLRTKTLGLMVDDRYLGDYRLRRSINYPHQRKAYFKSNSDELNENQIDTLYSELVVLFNSRVQA
ncbi:MAG TPA: hypothetical protein VF556_00030 [Pyrinomonadaceae bacterium]|jgi:hypothetical protein